MRTLLFAFVGAAFLITPAAQATYSIVVRDAETGELGVAVQSHWFDVGSAVPWAKAGVGAVATQSLVDISYGPLGLSMMAAGRSAEASLRGLLEADEHPEIRQVAMIDATGNVANHTGANCIPMAGDVLGEGYSCQANLMEFEGVAQAMSKAYEAAEGPLAKRLLAALDAAEAAGGDVRGKQSAAILIVPGEACTTPWPCETLRLSVEDHPDPNAELRRLYEVHLGYEAMNEGDLAVEAGEVERANEAYGQATEALGKDNLEASFWHAVSLANADDLDAALPIFGRIFAAGTQGARWAKLPPRLVESGFLMVDQEGLDRIQEQSP